MGRNPFAFRTLQVTIFILVVYIALFATLLTFHNIVPPAPSNVTPSPGINLTEAWFDLKELSNGFRPYNSRRSDEVRDFLLLRIESILKRNNNLAASKDVVVYNDMTANLTYSNSDTTVYFEGTNIIVHVLGEEESDTSGVLVNAHYDSVSTGYGATDNGKGVISVTQLISHFTTPGNKPRRGIVFLLNNGEEDFLNGANAFMRHPISRYPHIFLNLEGAGAGGRAILFRSTDTEVTRFYKASRRPVGSALFGDGFNRGAIRSQTDYIVFNGRLGLRGLDVAYYEPRARYHTVEDSTKFDSVDSLWHMLSSSLSTVKAMTSDTGTEFDGEARDDGKVNSGKGSEGVYFDMFGRALAVFQLHTLFALSVTLLVVTPIVLIAIHIGLAKSGKWYLFARRKLVEIDGQEVQIDFLGWRGFFRYPVAFVVSSGAVVALAFLQTKVNPFIIYSSEYSVWAMFLSVWICFDWFICVGAYRMRPTALTRIYALIWTYIGAYILLVGATIGENNLKIASGYLFVFYFAAVFFALLISYLEMFALPSKETYTLGDKAPVDGEETDHRPSEENEEEPTERTSLLRGDRQGTYSGYAAHRQASEDHDATDEPENDGTAGKEGSHEQLWANSFPSWTWIFQFLLFAPINIILMGQIALVITTGLKQTPADGNPVLTIYLVIAAFTVLLLTPLKPFMHKIHGYVPIFLFLVLAGTLIYNLVAFPFSSQARLKFYFIQRVDLDSGLNSVTLAGLDGYVQSIISELPSASGQPLNCTSSPSRIGLTQCSFPGLPPNVAKGANPWLPPGVPPEYGYKDWLNYTVKAVKNESAAVFTISAANSRACRIDFARAISAVNVTGSDVDPRLPPVGDHGAKDVRLWHRTWEDPWEVAVRWKPGSQDENDEFGDGMEGRVVCLWSDANTAGVIPALEEIWRFAPAWAVVSKAADGLVEGSKAFVV
ncbi:hypothetical protein NA57DRAFT_33880 [Rhizodiscina lignyota]|uniref:Peptide hydrolase n=1 Tax=Rhizodiscina lignyota TaxID=1504668 RepID=A0A9P4II44_9PEZI|nr:hypothetical protein NA57DRAFT_33880 [Rhizodiscina lignyota]